MSSLFYFGLQLKSFTRCSIIHKRWFSVATEVSKDADTSTSCNREASLQQKKIGTTIDDQKNLLKRKPRLEEDMRTLKVALIGTPNAGKSTLANRLVGWKFAPVSQKVHTTRHKILGVLSEGNNQVVFMDTPGVIVPSTMKKHKLCQAMLVDPHLALCESQMVVVVVDVSCLWNRTRLDHEVLNMLHVHRDKPAVLVLNKVDLLKSKHELLNTARILTEGCLNGRKYQYSKKDLQERDKQMDLNAMFKKCDDMKVSSLQKKNEYQSEDRGHHVELSDTNIHVLKNQPATTETSEELPQFTSSLTRLNLKDEVQWQKYQRSIEEAHRKVKTNGWPDFKEVFMVSAINGDGVFELKNFLLNSTQSSKWLYNPDVITTQNPKLLAQQIVWEKLLDNLPKEIPYQIEVKLMLWEIGDDDLLRAQFDLKCSRRRQIHHILGKDGEMIQKISREVKQELMNAFRRELTLQLIVKGTENTVPRLKKTEPKKNVAEINPWK